MDNRGGGGGGMNIRRCEICNGIDHLSRDCPRHASCYICGETGHFPISCQNRPSRQGAASHDAYVDRGLAAAGLTQHLHPLNEQACEICGLRDHKTGTCPVCLICESVGHFWEDCHFRERVHTVERQYGRAGRAEQHVELELTRQLSGNIHRNDNQSFGQTGCIESSEVQRSTIEQLAGDYNNGSFEYGVGRTVITTVGALMQFVRDNIIDWDRVIILQDEHFDINQVMAGNAISGPEDTRMWPQAEIIIREFILEIANFRGDDMSVVPTLPPNSRDYWTAQFISVMGDVCDTREIWIHVFPESGFAISSRFAQCTTATERSDIHQESIELADDDLMNHLLMLSISEQNIQSEQHNEVDNDQEC